MSIFSLFALFNCGTSTTLEKGQFEGQDYKLHSTEYKGFSTNSIKRSFKLGRLPTVDINATTTNWGPPYSDDVYGSAPFVYTAAHRLPYPTALEKDTINPVSTMLYLSPDRFSQSEFEQYVRFMKLEWPKIDAKYATEPGLRSFPHIIGLVYGKQEDFEQDFKRSKTDEDQGLHYTIYVDGRIMLNQDGGWRSSGLSETVQMPGKIIHLYTYPGHPQYGTTLEELKTYKDDKGKSIPDYFSVVPKEKSE